MNAEDIKDCQEDTPNKQSEIIQLLERIYKAASELEDKIFRLEQRLDMVLVPLTPPSSETEEDETRNCKTKLGEALQNIELKIWSLYDVVYSINDRLEI